MCEVKKRLPPKREAFVVVWCPLSQLLLRGRARVRAGSRCYLLDAVLQHADCDPATAGSLGWRNQGRSGDIYCDSAIMTDGERLIVSIAKDAAKNSGHVFTSILIGWPISGT
jgi:hypothetical protein